MSQLRSAHAFSKATAVLLLLSCSEAAAPPAPVASITITPVTDTVAPNTTLQLTATPKDASDHALRGRTLTWSSSNSNVASVSETGLLTGVSPGVSTITAYAEGKSGQAVMTVLVPVNAVVVTPTFDTLPTGTTLQLTATAVDFVGRTLVGRHVIWSVSNPAVAVVSQTGLVTTLTQGSLAISANVEGKIGTALIRVASVASVTIIPSPDTIAPNGSVQLTAIARDAEGNVLRRPATWLSETDLVTVSSMGLVTGKGLEGGALIRATSEGVTGTATVTVEIPVASVTVTPVTATLRTGETVQLTATARDAAGNILSGRAVVWLSTATANATVSGSGLVTAVRDGPATIVAFVRTKSASVGITVVVPVYSVAVSPSSGNIGAAGTMQLTARTYNSGGVELFGRVLSWSSSNDLVATVSTSGVVTGVSDGTVTITATSEGRSGTSAIRVASVAVLDLIPVSAKVVVGGIAHITATTKDAQGNILSGRTITWSSSNDAVATVSDTGLVKGVATGSATITARSESRTTTVAITVEVVSLSSVRAGGLHSCGVTTSGSAYCWGDDSYAALGTETTIGCVFEDYYYYYYTYVIPCDPAPRAVTGGVTFATVTPGHGHTCGLTSGGAAYCWGANYQGQLGAGTAGDLRATPSAVIGGRTFAMVSAGGGFTCGVTTTGSAYCWGANGDGQLGAGAAGADQWSPVAVTGGLTFTMVSAGGGHSCGVSTSGVAYCWGYNGSGALGNGVSGGRSATPVIVAGGHVFATVSAGSAQSCGVTTAGLAYCWGANGNGELGNGSTSASTTPVLVAGGLTFASVSAGANHTCGITTSGVAYCWGSGGFGQLGTGNNLSRTTPAIVSGGLSFASISAGSSHTCGLTTTSVAYCWGTSDHGQLGTGEAGASGLSHIPVKVTGQP